MHPHPTFGRSFFVPALLVSAVVLEAPPARAQRDDAATVEALFSDGKRLMAAGKTAEACPRFLASYNLEHRVGTVLNLAACYEKNGQLASAWARFVEARTLASRGNQAERAALAAQHASSLEARRSMLTIVVDHAVPGLVVRRDDVVVEPAAYGVPVPLDGGVHTVTATAPDRKPSSVTVTIGPEADRKTLYVPLLFDQPRPIEATSVAGSNRSFLAPATAPLPPPSHAVRGTIGLAIAGLGIVAAGVGGAFGVQALSKNAESNANGHCVGNACDALGFAARTAARSDGDVASVLVGAGAAALLGGVALWLTAPRSSSERASATDVRVGLGPAGIDLRGTF